MCKEERQFGFDDLTTTLKARAEWASKMRDINPVSLADGQPSRKTAIWLHGIVRLLDVIRGRLGLQQGICADLAKPEREPGQSP
jgi:hypothetical protein